jgi:hypothetical protein
MSDRSIDELGPVDYLVVEFPEPQQDITELADLDEFELVADGRIPTQAIIAAVEADAALEAAGA